MFCKFCGQEISDYAKECPFCLKNLNDEPDNVFVKQYTSKDWRITTILCVLLGPLGIHRFYTGHSGLGFFYWITLGGFCGLLPLIDLIQLLRDKYKDVANKPLINFNNTMSNVLALILCVGMVIGVLQFSMGNINTNANINLNIIDQFKNPSAVVTKNLNKDSIEYLRNYNYSNLYFDRTRNIVFYTKYDNSSVMQNFADRVEKYSIHPQYRKYYNFTYFKSGEKKHFKSQKEYDGWNAFKKQCHDFCIVNPKTDEITSIKEISQDNIGELYTIFNMHKN